MLDRLLEATGQNPTSTESTRDFAAHYLRRRGILPVVLIRKDQRASPRFDQATYRLRNVIERCAGWLKENRQLASRHAELAVNYLAPVKLAIIRGCLCLLADPLDRT